MAVILDDPLHRDRYLVAEQDGQPAKLGVQVASAQSDLTVYWAAKLSRDQMIGLVTKAAEDFAANQAVRGKFVAYGKDMRAAYIVLKDKFDPSVDETIVKDTAIKPLDVFEACRAELTATAGKVVVWANVKGVEQTGLENGGENIGVSVPPAVYVGAGRTFIEYAIELTMGMKHETISPLLDKFSEKLVHKNSPAAG